MLELHRIRTEVEKGLQQPEQLDATLATYCLYRAKAKQLLTPGMNSREAWLTRGDVYRVGAAVQRRVTEFVVENENSTLNIQDMVFAATARVPQPELKSELQTTLVGGVGTAAVATFMQKFIPFNWECADVVLDVDYGIDVVYADGTRVQSKVVQPQNYRHVPYLEKKIFSDGESALRIPILRFVQGSNELQFAPVALVPYGDGGALIGMQPNVLYPTAEQTVAFRRPYLQEKYLPPQGLDEALVVATEAVVDAQSYKQHLEEWAGILGIDATEVWPDNKPEAFNIPEQTYKLLRLTAVLPRIDNFDILARIKQAPGLSAFAKDITKSVLLSLKADQVDMISEWRRKLKPVCYTEMALFDMQTKKAPTFFDYIASVVQFMQGIKGISKDKFEQLDPFTDNPSFPNENLPVINL